MAQPVINARVIKFNRESEYITRRGEISWLS
jgi:hypothetical protein